MQVEGLSRRLNRATITIWGQKSTREYMGPKIYVHTQVAGHFHQVSATIFDRVANQKRKNRSQGAGGHQEGSKKT